MILGTLLTIGAIIVALLSERLWLPLLQAKEASDG